MDEEAWMFYNSSNKLEAVFRNSDLKLSISQVQLPSDLEIFLSIIAECFTVGHAKAIKNQFYGDKTTNYIHLLVEVEKEKVGAGSIYYNNDYAIIHNLGTLYEHRQKGVATFLLSEIIELALTSGKQLLLQSDGGGETELFYNKRGFRTKMRRLGFSLIR